MCSGADAGAGPAIAFSRAPGVLERLRGRGGLLGGATPAARPGRGGSAAYPGSGVARSRGADPGRRGAAGVR
jgi:hypothetical protein